MSIVWEIVEGELRPFDLRGAVKRPVAWAPQPGSQEAFLSCPIEEVLYEGNRGGGKTDCLLMDFASGVGRGYGMDYRGILFRETYPQLNDVINKSLKWFTKIFPEAKYNRQATTWTFPDGEQLLFRHMAEPEDYWNYHGHSYQWIGWEELTTWASADCYLRMFSTLRSANPRVPKKVRATTNPYGPGHAWVKARWRLPTRPGRVIGDVIRDSIGGDGRPESPRVSIRSSLAENRVLLIADPDYVSKLRSAAESEAQLKAWVEGSWDIVAGGMFDDRWDPRAHVLPDFPLILIPKLWRIDRSYDHGSSKPFSVGWWAESNGEPLTLANGLKVGVVRGDLIRIAEWYGWTGEPNKGVKMSSTAIARGILEREALLGIQGRVRPGPADSSIFDVYDPTVPSIGTAMAQEGVYWTPADKGPGSRKRGWQEIRDRLEAGATYPREKRGLFVEERCKQFIRTMPTLPRDERDMDDVNTKAEDHIADEVRYRVRAGHSQVKSGSF